MNAIPAFEGAAGSQGASVRAGASEGTDVSGASRPEARRPEAQAAETRAAEAALAAEAGAREATSASEVAHASGATPIAERPPTSVTPPTTRRPRGLVTAAVAQFAVAVAFLSIPLLGLVFADDVQAAAQAEVARRGQDPAILAEHGLAFNETGKALSVPFAVAALLTLTGSLTLAAKRAARVLAWIVLPLVALGNVAIMASNAAVVETLTTLFAESGDARLAALDAQGLVDAAFAAYPSWLPALETVRAILVFGGVLLALVTISAKSARGRPSRGSRAGGGVTAGHPGPPGACYEPRGEA